MDHAEAGVKLVDDGVEAMLGPHHDVITCLLCLAQVGALYDPPLYRYPSLSSHYTPPPVTLASPCFV